jgi:hypothetical protein
MFFFKWILALLLSLGVPVVGYVVYTAATAPSGNTGGVSSSGSTLTLHTGPSAPITIAHGVPGPIVGAGLPVIVVGYGVYWLVRRLRLSQ